MRDIGKRVLLLAFAAGIAGPMLQAQGHSPAAVRLQAALHAEEVEGNLARAIELYTDVAKTYGRERDVAARALFYLGRSYEKQGSQEATRAYQRVVREYGDQSEVATQARARLAALRPVAVASRGPDARRLLSSEETDFNDFFSMMPSPDGRRVAYVRVGSNQGLYVRDLATGQEERLASGLPRAVNLSPIWSPDGRRLAFLEADRENGSGVIKIIDVASHNAITVPGTSAQHQSPRDLSRNLNPLDWSRDGRFLLCRTVGPRLAGGIVLIPVEGGTSIPIADSVTPDWQATVSPDGRFVAYSVGAPDSAQVFVRSLGGGEPRQITVTGGNGSPVWSPDGRALAYARSDGIWVVPMESGRPAGTARLAYASTFWPRFPFAWTEAGGLYFTAWNDGSPVPYRFPVDPATGRPGVAAPDQLPGAPSRGVNTFAWSPDMRRVAFVGFNSPEITIYSEEQRTLAAHRVDPQPSPLRVGWSTDGREVLYASSNSQGVTWVAFDHAAGRTRELFPRRADRAVLSLSADGRRMLYTDMTSMFVADTGQASGVLVAPPIQDGSRFVRQQISPRGDQVLFGRQSNLSTGRYDPAAGTLWVVASDGTRLRSVGTPVYVITSAVWDPSGRFIAYSGMADSTTNVLRVVEVATGTEREFRLPNTRAQFVRVTSWSPDGRYIGVVIPAVVRAEYWVVQGLLERGR